MFLDAALAEIAALLDLSVEAVKAHLARGVPAWRHQCEAAASEMKPTSAAVARSVALFNQRDWKACARCWRTM